MVECEIIFRGSLLDGIRTVSQIIFPLLEQRLEEFVDLLVRVIVIPFVSVFPRLVTGEMRVQVKWRRRLSYAMQ